MPRSELALLAMQNCRCPWAAGTGARRASVVQRTAVGDRAEPEAFLTVPSAACQKTAGRHRHNRPHRRWGSEERIEAAFGGTDRNAQRTTDEMACVD